MIAYEIVQLKVLIFLESVVCVIGTLCNDCLILE